jgi:hypothetical protein
MGNMDHVTLDLHSFELYQQVGDDYFYCRSSQKKKTVVCFELFNSEYFTRGEAERFASYSPFLELGC